MSKILQRLRDRKLTQWGLAYVAAAFALLQGLDIVAQQFGWADGVRRGITIALVIGFFITLILAWYHGERGAQRVSGNELLILALLLAIGGGVLWRVAQGPRETASEPADATARKATSSRKMPAQAPASDKSIAVLLFANLSKDPDNAYFADGMQDEILTKLEEALKIAPDDTTARACLAQVEQRLGRLDAADAWLERVPKDTGDFYESFVHIDQARYRRNLTALTALTAPSARRPDDEFTNVDFIGLIRLGQMQRLSGQSDAAHATFERLARAIAARPGGVDHITSLAPLSPFVDAGLGDYEKAVTGARRQIEIKRNDTLELAASRVVLAQVLALEGDRDAAIALLPQLLEMPAGITPALLALDPLWDPNRDDPRFVALTKQPPAEYKGAPP